MPAKQNKRTGHWFFRKMVTFPDGTKRRIFGVPTDYGEKDTKAGALEAERIAITRIRESGTTDPKPPVPTAPAVKEVPTVEDFAPVWLAKSKADNKPSSVKHKIHTLNAHILPEFGKLRLDEIDFDKVETWRVRMHEQDEFEPATVARLLSEFRALLSYARKKGHIVAVPEWPSQPAPLGRPTFLSFEETDRLIAAAEPMDPWKAMVIVAVRTGLRHGELTGLRWEDVDLDGGKLSVVQNLVEGVFGTPKSGKDREVPLSNDAIRALRTIYKSRRGELVFSSKTGKPLAHWVTDNALRLICRHAKMMPIGWHKLRHTFASHLAIRGVSIMAIRELLGHANIKMTLRYAHLAPEVRREAVLLLDEPPPTKGKDKKSKKSKRTDNDDTNEE
ncbi:MAG: site-specific integrase [Kofleriaceae bacterium]|nr:site-specific integrase [Kofleriaceae bacterium]